MAEPDVLVTGSAGHLGHALMLQLSSYGYRPLGIDILPSEGTSVVGSIADRAFVANIFQKYRSIRFVLHAATLHKPHVESHDKTAFVNVNIQGTLNLLEEASLTGRIQAFIYTSTTSTFGDALAPAPGQPAAWIDEDVVPRPKNIYGVTKTAAEDLCLLVHRQTRMPTLVLKVSRFFPEADDNETARQTYDDDNLKVCELLVRRVDVDDVVSAHVCAMRRAAEIGWAKYIVSAPSPFPRDESVLAVLNERPQDVLQQCRPQQLQALLARGWSVPARIDRVYDSSRAIKELQWQPVYTFDRAIEQLEAGKDWRSALAVQVGKRGYHATPTGIYTT